MDPCSTASNCGGNVGSRGVVPLLVADTIDQMAGLLIAFEGLDQSGKETQAKHLRDHLREQGHKARVESFPDYGTTIGEEIARALQGEREYAPEVMQLLYVANRFERRTDLNRWLAGGLIVICDRYLASSIAYGEAQHLDPVWLTDMQRHLPKPDLTVLLDISADTAARRKVQDRDHYERDLEMLTRVRENYLRLASDERWVTIDGERSKAEVSEAVIVAAAALFPPP